MKRGAKLTYRQRARARRCRLIREALAEHKRVTGHGFTSCWRCRGFLEALRRGRS